MHIILTVHLLLVITQLHNYLIPYIYIVRDSGLNKVTAVSEYFPRNNEQAAVRFDACGTWRPVIRLLPALASSSRQEERLPDL